MYGPLDYPLEQEREDEARAADPVLHLIDLRTIKRDLEKQINSFDEELLKLKTKYEKIMNEYESEKERMMKEYEMFRESLIRINLDIIAQEKLFYKRP